MFFLQALNLKRGFIDTAAQFLFTQQPDHIRSAFIQWNRTKLNNFWVCDTLKLQKFAIG